MADKSSPSTAHQATNQAPTPPSASAWGQAPLPSATLLRGQKAVAITHNGMLYMLQATKLGKLILTK
jgi:hemin uptake protein HemP